MPATSYCSFLSGNSEISGPCQTWVEAGSEDDARTPQLAPGTLHVGDLEPNVSEHQLYEIFRPVGPLVSIRLYCDRKTGSSFGYAHVHYKNAEDARLARDSLNFTLVNGKTIRVMFLNGGGRTSGTRNIVVRNLEKSITGKDLMDTFSTFGSILSCQVATYDSGKSKRYGYVQFEQEESAQTAIENTNGMIVKNKRISVGPSDRHEDGEDPKFNKVLVKNISETTAGEELRKRFQVFGAVRSVAVMRDSMGRSLCHGSVTFEDSDDAAKAVEGLNWKKIGGREWLVERFKNKSAMGAEPRENSEREPRERVDQHDGVNVYIKNLDETVNEGMLWELFADFGVIKSCKIIRNVRGRSKGWGFIAFSTPQEANYAIVSMNMTMVGTKQLYVALAESKEHSPGLLPTSLETQAIVDQGLDVPTRTPMYQPYSICGGFYGQSSLYYVPLQPNDFVAPMPGAMGPGGGQNLYINAPVLPGQHQQGGDEHAAHTSDPTASGQRDWWLEDQHMMTPGQNTRFLYGPLLPQAVIPMLDCPSVSFDPIPTADFAMWFPAATGTPALCAASASTEPQAMLRQLVYPLVDLLDHDRASEVTEMLLQMDPVAIWYLFESSEAFIAKVAEAVEMLERAEAPEPAPNVTDYLARLTSIRATPYNT